MGSTTIVPLYSEVGQVARRFGVQNSTVHYWIREGLITPSARTLGGIYLFTERDLEAVAALCREREARKPGAGSPLDVA